MTRIDRNSQAYNDALKRLAEISKAIDQKKSACATNARNTKGCGTYVSGPTKPKVVIPPLPAPPKYVPLKPSVPPAPSELDKDLDRVLFNPVERLVMTFRRYVTALRYRLPRRRQCGYADVIDHLGEVKGTVTHIVPLHPSGRWPDHALVKALCGEFPSLTDSFVETKPDEVQLCPMCVLAALNGKR